MSAERVTVRSYRRIFRVERRIYRIDRWVLPVPGGVPLRALAYFALALGVVIGAGRLPLIGGLLALLSPPLRYLILPGAVAVLGTQVAPEGRAPHRFALAWIGFMLRSRRRSAGRALRAEGEHERSEELALRPDASTTELHRARIEGPCELRFAEAVRVAGSGSRCVARPAREGGRGTPAMGLELGPGERLEVRP